MVGRFAFLALCLCCVAVAEARRRRGSCLSLCGSGTGVTCPSGYGCQSNGCGFQCYRTTFQQPPGCPLPKCAYNCPLGFKRDENGCEGCECDYSALQHIFERRVSRRGSCILLCGSVNGVTCPSGYGCQSNGCGSQCYRTTFEQPPGCPLMKCAYNCPLGFKRDENGCEGCECDYSALQQVGK